jgi:lipid II:glycine glycyltransferase (peptidoglycan interpeptide bridge formation enzyme)
MQVIASTPMLGPLFSSVAHTLPSARLAQLLDALEVHLSAERVAHVELAWSGPVEVRPLLARGYQVERCDAVVLQLAGKSREDLWQGLAPACRRAVRKAEASGVEVVEAETGGFLPEYYGLCREVYRRAGRAPHLSLRFYAALWERFAATGHVRARLAMINDRMVAGALVLEHRGRVWYLSGASRRADEGLRPNNLLQWRTIEDATARGLALYDMGGATVPGITRFKQSFGATLQPYTRAWRTRSSAAHWGRRGYQSLLPVARRVAQRLLR